jgi:assimilatory nitrate reductase catalytic subunit
MRTTCPYCGVGCGVVARVVGGAVEVEGDKLHPANAGRLCVKGSALGETTGLDGRLLAPRVDGAEASWDVALDRVASGFRRIIDAYGPDAVAFYVSGQLLTEDYYVANKLMKGFIGSANIDTNSRLCMSSAVAGHKRAFGEDIVPVSYADLELADLVVLVGSNTAWCHPILFQRIERAREARPQMKLVVIDPRRTPTCENADLHLPIAPGTDVWLFNGLLNFLYEHSLADTAFVVARTDGADAALRAVATASVAEVARRCRIDAGLLAEFYRLFARTERVVTAFSQGVNQSSAGTDKVNSIINCHLLTGRIGQPGAGPFSITGQPNAMGGREVGGLSNTLAAHLDFAPAQRDLVQRFWQSPRIAPKPGLKAVELFQAIEAGTVKAVWIMATNPVVSLPDADQVKRALAKCELVVVSDVVASTDTGAYAHVLLPATAWGEKDGTVTNSERAISRQRAFLPAPGGARADWRIVCDVAQRLGFDGFAFDAPHQIFDEHARLSAFGNGGATFRGFNIGGLAGLARDAYDALEPVRWPVADTNQLFPGTLHLVPTPPRAPANAVDGEFPLVLNTGRIRDQWHTMTRSGRSPKLSSHLPEPFAELHPADAMLCGVRDGELVRVATRWGALVARLKLTADQRRGSVFVPIHWTAQVASDARVGALVNPAVDPISGEPEFKHTPARVEPFAVDWHGFVLSRRAATVDDVTWWTKIQGASFLRYELGGRGRVADWSAWARALVGVDAGDPDWLEYLDPSAGLYRGAHVVGERIEACVFVSPRQDLPSRAWLGGLFAKSKLAAIDRVGLLVGEPASRDADPGPTVCSCFGVGRNTIRRAIRSQNLNSAQAIGACLKAGTNCGSCVPELKSLLSELKFAAA